MAAAIDLQDAAGLFGAMNSRLRRAALDGLYSAALRSVQAIQTTIVPSRSPAPIDRGLFRAGWKARREPDGATIENLEPHAPFIEWGVRAGAVKPGPAMIRALVEWVERKGLASGGEATRAAWRIARAMQARGIFRGGRGFRILETLREWYLARFVEEEVGRAIEKVFG